MVHIAFKVDLFRAPRALWLVRTGQTCGCRPRVSWLFGLVEEVEGAKGVDIDWLSP